MSQRRISFKESISSAINNFICFEGRASRSEFWYFFLFNTIICIGIGIIATFFIVLGNIRTNSDLSWIGIGFFSLILLFELAMFFPNLGITCRRLHDIGKSGAFYFVSIFPIFGSIILLIWLTQPSEPNWNRFGNVPNLL